MLGDIIAQIIGEAAFGRLDASRRAQVLVRVFFGLLGTVLGGVGAWHFVATAQSTNRIMHSSMVAMFAFIALFSLFNVTFRRTWRWPGLGIVVSFVALFVSRILLGP
jgi:hypothetical protein